MCQYIKTVHFQRLLQGTEIIVENVVKTIHIFFHNGVNCAIFGRSHGLTDHAERIFIHRQQICHITLPQIFIKTIFGRYIQNTIHLVIHLPHQTLSGFHF